MTRPGDDAPRSRSARARVWFLVIAACLLLTGRAQSASKAVVLVGAGDIAICGSHRDEATARLLDRIVAANPDAVVFTAGDNVYPSGSYNQFRNCYDPSWGRHKARTRPAPGNHDYYTSGAAGYFQYFGDNAGPGERAYYSYNLGNWHIVSLNSNVDAGPGSAQLQWLRADLAANDSVCTLAYWHHPLFSSGPHGNTPRVRALFKALYRAGADVVVNGHDHDYERFAPQNPYGRTDPEGIRVFVVGTGGAPLRPFDGSRPNSVVRNAAAHGVLKFTLKPASYSWKFVPVAGKTFSDSGSAGCLTGTRPPAMPSAPEPPSAGGGGDEGDGADEEENDEADETEEDGDEADEEEDD